MQGTIPTAMSRAVFISTMLMCGATAVADCVAPPSGLVSWWKAEGNALDSVNGVNNGVLMGNAGFAPGKVGLGFSLDGNGSYIRVPHDASQTLTNELTIELWYKSEGDGSYGVFTKHNKESGPIDYDIDLTPGVRIYAYFNDPTVVDSDEGSHFEVAAYLSAPASGAFHHLAATFKQLAADTVETRVYVDAQLVRARTFNASLARAVSTAPILIGATVEYPSYEYFKGIIDEVSLYSRALGSNEIAAIYNADSAGKCVPVPPVTCVPPPAGLLSWWRAESNAVDSVGISDGVLTGNAGFAPGKVGLGFSLDGNGSYIRVPHNASQTLTNELTIELWYKSEGDGSYGIFNKHNSESGPIDYGIAMTPGVRISTYFNDPTIVDSDVAGDFEIAYYDTAPASGAFHHLAATFKQLDGNTVETRVYVDAQLVRARTFNASLARAVSSAPILIGATVEYPSYEYFKGIIDEVSLYNRALSSNEISAIFNADSSGKCVPVPPAECVTPPFGLVSWWRAEGNGVDSFGVNNGLLENGLNFAEGEVGQSFGFAATNAAFRIPASASLDVGAGNGFTFESWISPSNVTNYQPIAEWNSGSGWGVHFFVDPLSFGNGPGTLYANIVDSTGGWHQVYSAPGVVLPNMYQHVAMTYDKLSGVCKLYRNGVVVVQQDIGSFTPLTTFDLYLGRRPGGDLVLSFAGSMDESSLYNRALTSNEIAAIYSAGSYGKCALPVVASDVPKISGFMPLSGTNGTIVAISGTNFSETAGANIVYFGAVRAEVLSASLTELNVMVPSGATYAPITVAVNGKVANSDKSFLPTFAGNGSNITASSFAPGITLPTGDGPGRVVIADLDGDGHSDLAVANAYGYTISLFRNAKTNGSLDSTTFVREELQAAGGSLSPYMVEAADVDGDGKLDLVAVNRGANTVSVFRNVSGGPLGTNSFAPRVDFAVGATPMEVVVRDLDGDGRPEITTANYSDNSISVLKNIGTSGVLNSNSFAAAVSFPAGAGAANLVACDVDGDGKPDIAVVNYDASVFSVLRNVAVFGEITSNSFAPKVDFPAPASCQGIAAADLDGDGKTDLILGSLINGQMISIVRNTATPGSITADSFAPKVDFATGGWAHTVALGDLNGDGKPDIAAACELSSHLSVFQNATVPGGFNSASLLSRVDLPSGWNAWGVSVGDLDGDGRPDVAFVNTYDDTLTIYPNVSGFENTEPTCVAPPAGLVSWWKAEGNAVDTVTGSSGILSGGMSFGSGKVGTSFVFDGASGKVKIPATTNLNVGAGPGLTLEAWVNPATLGLQPLFEWNSGSGSIGVHVWMSVDGSSPGDGVGNLYANVQDTFGNDHRIVSSAGVLATNQFYHVALTYDKASGTGTLYCNGAIVKTLNLGTFTPETRPDLYFGERVSGPFSGVIFGGKIDEPTLYNRALSSNEIAAIYHADSLGKCYDNQFPMAGTDAFTTPPNAPVSFSAAKLLLNDSDPDGDALKVISVSPTSTQGGSVSLVTNAVTYTPAIGFTGNDFFTYTISDNHGGSAVGTVAVTVGHGGTVSLNVVFGPINLGGDFLVQFAGIPGLTYTVEVAPSLSGPWTKAANLTAPTTNTGLGIGVFQFVEPIGTNGTRFYRTVYPAY